MTLGDWFDLAARIGLDGADISVVHLDSLAPGYLRDVRSQADDRGLRIPMLVTYSDFTHPIAEERTRQRQALVRHIEAAQELGAVVYPRDRGPGAPRRVARGWHRLGSGQG